MGEWFRIMEHFWQFSLCNVVILPSVEFWVQLWHICAGIIPRHWQAPIGFVWSESNGSPFLVVGVVSRVWRAVLHLFVPGLQSGETPDLDPDLNSLQCLYLWYLIVRRVAEKGSLLGSQVHPMAVQPILSP